MDNHQPNVSGRKLFQGGLEGLCRTLHVCLDDNLQLHDTTSIDGVVEVVQSNLAYALSILKTLQFLTFCRNRASSLFGVSYLEWVTSVGHGFHTKDFHGHTGSSFLNLFSTVVEDGTNTAGINTCNEGIACGKGSPLHNNGGHNTTSMVNTGFYNLSLCTTVPCGTELQNFSLQEDGIQQVLQAFLFQGTNVNKLSVSTPIFWNQSQVGKLGLYTVGICLGLVHLVYCNNDGNLGILGVIDSFDSLGHNTVIGGNHQNNNISNLGTTGTHHGKCFVTRCIQEGNASLVCFYHVGTDVLGNSTELTFCYTGTADGIQGLCLTVVNVTHDGNNGRTNLNIAFFTSIAFDNSLVVQADDVYITIILGSQ